MYSCKIPAELHFGIVVDDVLIGIISIENINWISRNAYLTVAIYDEDFHGKGYGKESVKLVLDYIFDYLNLLKVNIEVYEYNSRAIKLYENLGFKFQGKLKSNNERFGKRHDVIIMGITRRDYRRDRDERT